MRHRLKTFWEAAPALEVTAKALAEGRARSMFGRVLGHYEIVMFLGAGGMGEVYRARDSRIERDVAVKVLPPAVAAQFPSDCAYSNRRPEPRVHSITRTF